MYLGGLGLKVGRWSHVRASRVGLLDLNVLVGRVLLLHHDVGRLSDEGGTADLLVSCAVVGSVVLVEGTSIVNHVRRKLWLDGRICS